MGCARRLLVRPEYSGISVWGRVLRTGAVVASGVVGSCALDDEGVVGFRVVASPGVVDDAPTVLEDDVGSHEPCEVADSFVVNNPSVLEDGVRFCGLNGCRSVRQCEYLKRYILRDWG